MSDTPDLTLGQTEVLLPAIRKAMEKLPDEGLLQLIAATNSIALALCQPITLRTSEAVTPDQVWEVLSKIRFFPVPEGTTHDELHKAISLLVLWSISMQIHVGKIVLGNMRVPPPANE